MPDTPLTPHPDLAADLCGRICHDIAGPLGAAANALELLDPTEPPDPDILNLLQQGLERSRTALEISRIAFAQTPAGVDIRQFRTLLAALCTRSRIRLQWDAAATTDMPGDNAAILVNVILMAAACLPKGGTLTVAQSSPPVAVSAQGDIRLPDDAPSARNPCTLLARHLAARHRQKIHRTHTGNELTLTTADITVPHAADRTATSTTPPSRST